MLRPPSGRTPSTSPTGRTPGGIARAHQAACRASTAMGHQQPAARGAFADNAHIEDNNAEPRCLVFLKEPDAGFQRKIRPARGKIRKPDFGVPLVPTVWTGFLSLQHKQRHATSTNSCTPTSERSHVGGEARLLLSRSRPLRPQLRRRVALAIDGRGEERGSGLAVFRRPRRRSCWWLSPRYVPRRKWNEGDGAVRAAARLNSAGYPAFSSSVEARHRGLAAGRRERLYLAYKKVDGTWAWNGGLVLEMRVKSQDRTWIPRVVWRAFGAV